MLGQLMYKLGLSKLFENIYINIYSAHLEFKKCLTYVTSTEF